MKNGSQKKPKLHNSTQLKKGIMEIKELDLTLMKKTYSNDEAFHAALEYFRGDELL